MGLIENQARFFADLCRLRDKAVEKGYTVTLGEVERTQYQQDEYLRSGKSKKRHSVHQDRLAADLHFYRKDPRYGVISVDTQLTGEQAKRELTPLGEYWESLDPMNVWGGFFPEHYGTTFIDCPHFERRK